MIDRREGIALFAGVAATLALGLGATPALASPTLTVRVTRGIKIASS